MDKKVRIFIFLFINISIGFAQSPVTNNTTNWDVSYHLTSPSIRLAYPYEITYGPDNWLWITERGADGALNLGERIVRVNPADWTKEQMLNLTTEVSHSTSGGNANAQDGLLGMAIHPDLYGDLNTSNNYVFIAYTYGSSPRKAKIVRLLYNPLGSPNKLSIDTSLNADGTVIDELPASNDHNSGRLKIGPDLKLYYTIGDQGSNQFGNACNPIMAQVLPSQAEVNAKDYTKYPGKLLRLNLDGSIPSDNPTFDHDGDGGTTTPEVLSHIYTFGHRNHQGLIFAANGDLYNSEHGAKVDDEINKIVAGGNYGWPLIAGYYDNKSYSYCNWSASAPDCNSSYFGDHNCPDGSGSFGGRLAPSLTEEDSFATIGDLPSDFEPPIGTYGSTVNSEPSGDWLTWPTVAPSSIDIYEAGLIPGWGKSLFITTLKEGTIFRAKLTAGGNDIEGDLNDGTKTGYEEFHSSTSRYRDLTFDPDGLTMYAITDTGGTTSGPSGSSSTTLTHKGEIVKIKYIGSTLSVEDEILSAFQLYPNPSDTGEIKLKVPNEIQEFTVVISNAFGQKLYSKSLGNNYSKTHKIKTQGFKTGVYIVTLSTNLGKFTKKLVIE